ncbi:disease resistance protein RGA5-like [Miscanthus floridulus]|uniref:disease resistance protein RGA5-like n=1 Tax=Miscanthus floridulus TaxID=154761 RepID=UPI00345A77DF
MAHRQGGNLVLVVGEFLLWGTLANVVYEKLKGQFDCLAFVSVSQTPDMEKIFNNLLYQLDKRNNIRIDVIVDDLREFLQKKRYLIVTDDIWDISDWKHIRCALPPNNAGCKIITTTRNMRVAEEVGGAYKMKPLDLHCSRILLYGGIFGHEGRDKCPNEELVEVSNKILTKCDGVPLGIITIASLMASKERNKLEWYEVCNSIGTGMENNIDVENMRNVLLLSYYHLKPHLRTCLLYLSVFPKDYEIDKRRLIWMWIAEGFIQCGKQGQSLFEVRESYFNELINRSMIEPVYYMDTMKVQSCRVHDVVLDLIRSLSGDENFATSLYGMGHASPSQKIRRLSIQNGKVNEGTHGATVSMQQVRSAAFSSVVNLIPALCKV